MNQSIKCFFGFHPRNPAGWIVEQAYFAHTCHNGTTDWYEWCPKCERKHYSKALNEEMRLIIEARDCCAIRKQIVHCAPKGWRGGFESWFCGAKKSTPDMGTDQENIVSCPDCLLGMLLVKSLDKYIEDKDFSITRIRII